MASTQLEEWLDGLVGLMREGLSWMPTDGQLRANFPAIDLMCGGSTCANTDPATGACTSLEHHLDTG